MDFRAQEMELPTVDLQEVRARCDEEVVIERLYLPFSKIGLPLQPRFRTVRHILRGDEEVLAKIEAENDGTNVGYLFNPAVLDGTFQGSMALMLARRATEVDDLHICIYIYIYVYLYNQMYLYIYISLSLYIYIYIYI